VGSWRCGYENEQGFAAKMLRPYEAAYAQIRQRQRRSFFKPTGRRVTMKSTQILKAAGSIACVVFALNVSAQTATTSTGASTSIGTKVDDTAVTTKVKAELLGAKNVKSTHIHVKTRAGVVSLTGTVPSAEDKSGAEDVVSKVDGVASVRNHLKIVE
jgi:hyperosmotically inducible periplasmic protein